MEGKKKVLTIMENEEGFTLVELLVSIAILALIVGAFSYMFVFATKTIITTEEVVNTGYIAQTCMEEVYTLSTTKDTDGIKTSLVSDGYNYSNLGASGDGHKFTKEIEGYYVKIEIKRKAYPSISDDLTKVNVGVYKDSGHTDLAASVQNIINTIGSPIAP
ncbi:MAG: type II secretion system protein [Clostridiales bacterium]|nr:type II secretion system protein [Clostridiales bacterium]